MADEATRATCLPLKRRFPGGLSPWYLVGLNDNLEVLKFHQASLLAHSAPRPDWPLGWGSPRGPGEKLLEWL